MLRQSAAALLLLLPRRPVVAFSSAAVVPSYRRQLAFVSAARSNTRVANKSSTKIIVNDAEGRRKPSFSTRATQQLSHRMSGQQEQQEEQQQFKRQKRSDIRISIHS